MDAPELISLRRKLHTGQLLSRYEDWVILDALTSLQAEVERLRADLREAAMQALADAGQAQLAYEAQLKAEAEAATYRGKYWSLCQRLASDERSRFSDNSIWPEVTEVAAVIASGGKSGGSNAP